MIRYIEWLYRNKPVLNDEARAMYFFVSLIEDKNVGGLVFTPFSLSLHFNRIRNFYANTEMHAFYTTIVQPKWRFIKMFVPCH